MPRRTPMRAPRLNLFRSVRRGVFRSLAASNLAGESTATAHGRTGCDSLTLGREKIDLRYVAQLVDSGQTLALARAAIRAHPVYQRPANASRHTGFDYG